MSVPHELFDEDYLYFYARTLTDERGEAEAASIVRLLELAPGVRVLDAPDRIARLAAPAHGTFSTVTERDGDLMIDRVRYDPSDAYSHTERFIVRAGKVRKIEFSLEQVPVPQLVRRLEQAGLSDVRLVGRDGEPFGPQSARMIALARRAA